MPRKPATAKAPKKSAKKGKKSTTKNTKSKTTKKERVESKKPVQEVVSDVEAEPVQEKKKRHVPTKESILEEFDALVASIDAEVSRLRESTTKATGVKFLRSLCKRVKTTRGHAARVMKAKKKTTRRSNTNSGFLKPVKVSKEICKFTGWNPDELRSRVEVTKYLCNYIKEKDLQNPEDRRQILADDKLRNLLKYDPEEGKPLTYYALQTYLKPHFTKV